MATPKRYIDAIHIGTGEFSFCNGATSLADTRPPNGYRDVGNLEVYQPQISNDTVEREGSYRGKKVVDASFSTKQQLSYLIRCDEATYDNLIMTLMGEDLDDNARDALADDAIDVMPFTATKTSASKYWYDLNISNEQQTHLTSAVVFGGAPVSATTAETGDTFTKTGHGLTDGDRVMLVTLTTTTGATIKTPYFVVGVSGDTFQLSATSGGSALDLSDDGTATYLAALTADTDYEIDLDVGRIRFLDDQSADVYAFVTADAITSSDDNYMKSLKPLQQASFEGYGRLLAFNAIDGTLTLDHRDFSCTITPQNFTEQDGKKPSTFEFMVKVTGDPGKVFTGKKTIND